MTTPLYCFDAGALINAHRYIYPLDMFPRVWEKLAETFRSGNVFLCAESFDEIKSGGVLHEWARDLRSENPELVRATSDAIFHRASEIRHALAVRAQGKKLASDRSSVAWKSQQKKLDDFKNDILVIAHAESAGAIVVAEEKRDQSNPNAYKIPNVCRYEGVPCIKILRFMQNENYRFP